MDKYQYHIFSPYRVCPLGAHVDHQHGLVTGFAIDKGVDLWFSVNGSSQRETSHVKGEMWGENHVHLESKTFEGTVDFDIDAPSQVRSIIGATMLVVRSMRCGSDLNSSEVLLG